MVSGGGKGLKVLDSSSKIPSGLLMGNFIELGMYDECMSVHVQKNGSKIVVIACALFLLLLIFMIIDLLKEIKAFKCDLPQAVCELSLYKNIRGILSLKDSPGSISALHGLRTISMASVILGHGILLRAMSLHSPPVTVDPPLKPEELEAFKRDVHKVQHLLNEETTNMNIFKALHKALRTPKEEYPPITVEKFPLFINIITALVMYGVDTFLTISGFLLSYSFLKKYAPSQGELNLYIYYLHRYIRLTAAIIAALLASIYLVPFMGSGPKWRKVLRDMTTDSCQQKWWTIFLYIDNFVDPENNCMPYLWSTAVDMHFFWISPLILYPLGKKPKLGLFILGLLLVASLALPAAEYKCFVTKFLSLPVFFPLSRLSYCLYLIHIFLQILNTQTFLGFLEDMFLSLIVATFFCIIFEIPVRTLERLVLNPSATNRNAERNLDKKKRRNSII
ncbi:nose resistant to fluoxetine protein 6-like [Belonocnema kinseyi]|uniref:nose resistant to fluoxetine protein 6-like n=1 Tax=Belonocnema kinseyi TaxID=2817044 RepID=UPI00143D7D87|nr:nose resistant to fluoxetine protein 6-like [Belonocnema kinseyi]